jgi:choline dehydrogenase-like flavoprotein
MNPGFELPTSRATYAALLRASVVPSDLTDELVVATVEDVERLVAALPPAARGVLKVSLRVLEAASGRPRFGSRRFSRLDPDDEAAYVGWWDTTPLALRRVVLMARDLVVLAFYEQPEVRRGVGYEPAPWIRSVTERRRGQWAEDIADHQRLLAARSPLRPGSRSARPAGQIRPGSELASGAELDVVVIGSGAGGAVVAAELAEAGLAVAVVEEGEHHRTEEFTTRTLDMLRLLYRDCGAATTLGRAPVQFSEGRCVGGSTVVNGGMAFRASERVLQRWASAAGLAGLDLDDQYARVERFLSVRPPDRDSIGRDQELLKAGAERLGWRVIECLRAHVHCGGCNVCVWGCPTGAKQSTLVSYLPRALTFGANVWTGCRVDQVLMNGKRAVGVRTNVAGQQVTVRAKRVVVAAGAVQTPALLQRSRIATPSHQVGRNLTLHPGAAVTAVFDEEVTGWAGAHESYQVRQFENEGIILAAVNLPPSLVTRTLHLQGSELHDAMADYPHMVTAGVLVEDSGSGRVRAVGSRDVAVTYPVSRLDSARVLRAVTLLGEALFAAGARRLYLPIDGVQPVFAMDELRRLAGEQIAPARMELSTVHLMGTARLGADPVTSACDPYGAVRDTERLYVADASLFPGPVGVNPQLTVMALATRVAERIIDTW